MSNCEIHKVITCNYPPLLWNGSLSQSTLSTGSWLFAPNFFPSTLLYLSSTASLKERDKKRRTTRYSDLVNIAFNMKGLIVSAEMQLHYPFFVCCCSHLVSPPAQQWWCDSQRWEVRRGKLGWFTAVWQKGMSNTVVSSNTVRRRTSGIITSECGDEFKRSRAFKDMLTVLTFHHAMCVFLTTWGWTVLNSNIMQSWVPLYAHDTDISVCNCNKSMKQN